MGVRTLPRQRRKSRARGLSMPPRACSLHSSRPFSLPRPSTTTEKTARPADPVFADSPPVEAKVTRKGSQSQGRGIPQPRTTRAPSPVVEPLDGKRDEMCAPSCRQLGSLGSTCSTLARRGGLAERVRGTSDPGMKAPAHGMIAPGTPEWSRPFRDQETAACAPHTGSGADDSLQRFSSASWFRS
jgi:hypothetical protein